MQSTRDFLADLREAIAKFHDFTIRRHGGLPGFRDEGLFALSVERPWMTVGGDPAYKTPFEKAAAIAEAIVRNHHSTMATTALRWPLHIWSWASTT